jgi:hypothetical protein
LRTSTTTELVAGSGAVVDVVVEAVVDVVVEAVVDVARIAWVVVP